jgi:hypothetical protein
MKIAWKKPGTSKFIHAFDEEHGVSLCLRYFDENTKGPPFTDDELADFCTICLRKAKALGVKLTRIQLKGFRQAQLL